MNYTSQFSPNDTYIHIIDYGTENQIEVQSFKRNLLKRLCALFLTIISFGVVGLVFHWKRHWFIRFTCDRSSIDDCDLLIIIDKHQIRSVSYIKLFKSSDQGTHNEYKKNFLQVPDIGGVFNQESIIKYFEHHKNLYIWRGHDRGYTNINEFEKDINCSYFYKQKPLSKEEQDRRRIFFGPNDIKVKVRPIYKILFYEVLTPFYIFQIFSVILWFNDEYELYASCILIISLISLAQSTYEIRKDQIALHNLSKMIDVVTVFRDDNNSEEIPSVDLVPGDVIKIPAKGCLMTCDAIVLNGSCIVNESMLTGESIPVTKTPLPNLTHSNTYDYKFERKRQFKHLLYCGTQVIQARYYGTECTKAIVLSTGFNTSKGEIIRSILFPKPSEFNFNQDSYKFIAALFGLSIIGFLYSSVLKIMSNFSIRLIILRSVDLVTIVVPPALPAAMTIGIVFAKSRLKRYNIFCISPNHINVCGVIDLLCFDKTGTLTEDGLDIWGIIPYPGGKGEGGSFSPPLATARFSEMGPLLYCMASCHSLTTIEGELIGDPLDIKMFESTGWHLKEPSIDDSEKYDVLVPTVVQPPSYHSASRTKSTRDAISPHEIGIIRQFPFLSVFQRMSVVIYRLGSKEYEIYCKGSPEKISSLCDPSTLPASFHSDLVAYTEKGFRVIALAWKALPNLKWAKIQRINRDQVERDLTFLGLLVFENKLKPATIPTLEVLKRGNVRTVMVTGDNLLTAVAVARECRMIEASTGVKLIQTDPSTEPPGIRVVDLDSCTETPSSDDVDRRRGDQLFTPKASTVPEITYQPSALASKFLNRNSVPGSKGPKHSVPGCHLAMTGDTFQTLLDNNLALLERILAASAQPSILEDGNEMGTPCSDSSQPGGKGGRRPIVATVFARMTPDQKAALVERFQALDYYVGMCGDGANDCGALKTAHAGIALSDAEASIVSPFTYRGKDIKACVPLIQEGRCSLVTSFGVFKYMAGYSLTQFVSVLILYWIGASFSDQQFAYVDLCIITLHAITFGRTRAYSVANRKAAADGAKTLLDPLKAWNAMAHALSRFARRLLRCVAKCLCCHRQSLDHDVKEEAFIDDDRIYREKIARRPPNSSLVSFAPIFSVVSQLLIQTAFLIATYFWVKRQPWYVPYDPTKDPEEEFFTHMVTAIFYASAFQYITQAMVTAKGPPYRMPAYTNRLFMAAAAFSVAFTSLVLVLFPAPGVVKFFYLEPLPVGTAATKGFLNPRLFILLLAATDLVVSLAFERLVVDRIVGPLTRNRDILLRRRWPRHVEISTGDAAANLSFGSGQASSPQAASYKVNTSLGLAAKEQPPTPNGDLKADSNGCHFNTSCINSDDEDPDERTLPIDAEYKLCPTTTTSPLRLFDPKSRASFRNPDARNLAQFKLERQPCLKSAASPPALVVSSSPDLMAGQHPAFRDTESHATGARYFAEGQRRRGASYDGPPLLNSPTSWSHDKGPKTDYAPCAETTTALPLGKLYVPKDITKL